MEKESPLSILVWKLTNGGKLNLFYHYEMKWLILFNEIESAFFIKLRNYSKVMFSALGLWSI